MASILIYTFFGYGKATSRGLYSLDATKSPIDKLFISSRFATNTLLARIKDYDYVIGIADHNKRAIHSRFDPIYCNKYANRQILENGAPSYEANLSIEYIPGIYRFYGATNGPCNRSAYLVMETITRQQLDTKFGLFHLSKRTWEEDLMKVLGTIRGFSTC